MGNEGGALQGEVRVKTSRIWALIWESYKFCIKDLMFFSVVNGETLNVFEQRNNKIRVIFQEDESFQLEKKERFCDHSLPKDATSINVTVLRSNISL